jgi:hypothetical protein
LPAFSADMKNLHTATSHSETALLHPNNFRNIGLYQDQYDSLLVI